MKFQLKVILTSINKVTERPEGNHSLEDAHIGADCSSCTSDGMIGTWALWVSRDREVATELLDLKIFSERKA